MGKKKDQPGSLGRSVIKSRFAKTHKNPNTFLHTTELPDGCEWGRLNLTSITEQSNLADFLSTAEMAGTEFIAEKMNVMVVDPGLESGLPGAEALRSIRQTHEEHRERLKVPRRPEWNENTSKEDLDQLEREIFIEWRRDLSLLQQEHDLIMTPYEKNLEFWRQLWRVIERSDVVVQIVDARNPLLFYCEDLVTYTAEVGVAKVCMVLINKADLLTASQRLYWSDYFISRGVLVAFWSALEEAARHKLVTAQDEPLTSDSDVGLDSDGDDSDGDDSDGDDSDLCAVTRGDDDSDVTRRENLEAQCEQSNDKLIGDGNDRHLNVDGLMHSGSQSEDVKQVGVVSNVCEQSNVCDANKVSVGDLCNDLPNASFDNTSNIEVSYEVMPDTVATSQTATPIDLTSDVLTVDQLLGVFRRLRPPQDADAVTTVGMVGYPNVGKSCTINTILQTKKVPVSATPGRTKHFQTLYVDEDLMLCDCPGLVFPSFVTTKAELIVNGILPIDQMREHIPPMSLVCERIPRNVLCRVYGIMLPAPSDTEDPQRPPTAHEMLAAYALMRGYMTHKGLPDGPRASRHILKDYVNGKLVYSHPPPGTDVDLYQPTATCLVNLIARNKPVKDNQLMVAKPVSDVQGKVDKDFFHEKDQQVHVMGGNAGTSASSGRPVQAAGPGMREKPWRVKEKRSHKKREKLRRVYKDLDIH